MNTRKPIFGARSQYTLTGRDHQGPLHTLLLVLATCCGLNSSFHARQECLWPPCSCCTSFPSPSEFPATQLTPRHPTASHPELSALPQVVRAKRFHKCNKSVTFYRWENQFFFSSSCTGKHTSPSACNLSASKQELWQTRSLGRWGNPRTRLNLSPLLSPGMSRTQRALRCLRSQLAGGELESA